MATAPRRVTCGLRSSRRSQRRASRLSRSASVAVLTRRWVCARERGRCRHACAKEKPMPRARVAIITSVLVALGGMACAGGGGGGGGAGGAGAAVQSGVGGRRRHGLGRRVRARRARMRAPAVAWPRAAVVPAPPQQAAAARTRERATLRALAAPALRLLPAAAARPRRATRAWRHRAGCGGLSTTAAPGTRRSATTPSSSPTAPRASPTSNEQPVRLAPRRQHRGLFHPAVRRRRQHAQGHGELRPRRPRLSGQQRHDASAMVPWPAGATPDPQSDHHLLIIDHSSMTEWGMWNVVDDGGQWHCGLGATMDLSGSGVRPLAEGNPTWYTSHGPRACGFALVAGLIRREEIAAGAIEHALIVAYPHIQAGICASFAGEHRAGQDRQRRDQDPRHPLRRPHPVRPRRRRRRPRRIAGRAGHPARIAAVRRVRGRLLGEHQSLRRKLGRGAAGMERRARHLRAQGQDRPERLPRNQLGPQYDNGNGD